MVSTTVMYINAPLQLHNSKTDWSTYREILQDRINLSVLLQDDTGIDRETSNLIYLLHQAAKESTPNYCQHAPSINININIPTEIRN
jgi:hypothetical protein